MDGSLATNPSFERYQPGMAAAWQPGRVPMPGFFKMDILVGVALGAGSVLVALAGALFLGLDILQIMDGHWPFYFVRGLLPELGAIIGGLACAIIIPMAYTESARKHTRMLGTVRPVEASGTLSSREKQDKDGKPDGLEWYLELPEGFRGDGRPCRLHITDAQGEREPLAGQSITVAIHAEEGDREVVLRTPFGLAIATVLAT